MVTLPRIQPPHRLSLLNDHSHPDLSTHARQVLEQFPDEYRKRKEDKYGYRYPRGESYQDVFLRLEPVIFGTHRGYCCRHM